MQRQNNVSTTDRGITLRVGDCTLRIDMAAEGIARLRKFPGDKPPASPLTRYGLFRDEWPTVKFRVEDGREAVTLSTDLVALSVDKADGRLMVRDGRGRELLSEKEPASAGPQSGFEARFHLPPERAFFGLGDSTRARIEHRGTKGDLWGRNVSSYIPVPLFMTNDGFGLLLNTTRRVWFDLGATSADWFGFHAEGTCLDYYFLYGPSLREILGRYTEVTGRPPMPPKWALGLWFICRTQADAREFIDDCYTFRREGIPCDAIGLEPGWMAKFYDFSVTKDWHPERFPVPSYARAGRHNFFPAARRMGFKPGLWLCCDYDLSYEEERRVKQAVEPKDEQGAFAKGHELDEHLKGAKRMDTLTRPAEPWYEHLKKFVDAGAEWFKQDGANQVLTHPDRLYGNGMHDDEMHNLYPLLYSKQMYQGFREHTGRRPFCFTPSGWAGLQRWTGTWTGDTGGEEGPLGACLNLSLSGHGMSTCDMEVTTREGIHFGFLLPWAQVNSWNYWRHPWLLGDELKPVFTAYAKLRYRLLPYLYSVAWDAHTTGMPMMRAMPLEFTADRQTHGLIRQYMLGPALLVGAFTKSLYLPHGDWFDFWTGQKATGPKTFEAPVPPDRGGPLFVRAGSIIPMGREMDYVGQKPDDELTVLVYAGDGRFVLYEDDGKTFEHEQGAFRTTEIRQTNQAHRLSVEIAAAVGSFSGAPTRRKVRFEVFGVVKPCKVHLDGVPVQMSEEGPAPAWRWDESTQALTVCAGKRDVKEKTTLSAE